jgi:hypothetical protein
LLAAKNPTNKDGVEEDSDENEDQNPVGVLGNDTDFQMYSGPFANVQFTFDAFHKVILRRNDVLARLDFVGRPELLSLAALLCKSDNMRQNGFVGFFAFLPFFVPFFFFFGRSWFVDPAEPLLVFFF